MSSSKKKPERVMVIPDLHAPFIRKGFLEFCVGIKKNFRPTKIIQIGDLVDNHAISQHDTHPNADGSIQELDLAIESLKGFYKAFPEVTVTIGNHDDRIARRAASVRIPARYLKGFLEVLKAPPGWRLVEKIEIDDNLYLHGTGSSGKLHAYNLAVRMGQSVICGHTHSNFGVKYSASPRRLIFGVNVGGGMDTHTYAMEYAKSMIDRPVIGCAIIEGKYAQIIPMDLGGQ